MSEFSFLTAVCVAVTLFAAYQRDFGWALWFATMGAANGFGAWWLT